MPVSCESQPSGMKHCHSSEAKRFVEFNAKTINKNSQLKLTKKFVFFILASPFRFPLFQAWSMPQTPLLHFHRLLAAFQKGFSMRFYSSLLIFACQKVSPQPAILQARQFLPPSSYQSF